MVSIYNFLKRSVLRAKGRVRSLGFRLCRAQAFSISEFRARACSTVAPLKGQSAARLPAVLPNWSVICGF